MNQRFTPRRFEREFRSYKIGHCRQCDDGGEVNFDGLCRACNDEGYHGSRAYRQPGGHAQPNPQTPWRRYELPRIGLAPGPKR